MSSSGGAFSPLLETESNLSFLVHDVTMHRNQNNMMMMNNIAFVGVLLGPPGSRCIFGRLTFPFWGLHNLA